MKGGVVQEFLGSEGWILEPEKGRQSLVYRVTGTARMLHLWLLSHIWTWYRRVQMTGVSIHSPPTYVTGWSMAGVPWTCWVSPLQAHAVRPYLAGELQSAGDLIFCVVADEEAGGRLGSRALVEDYWEMVRADYPMTDVAFPRLPRPTERHPCDCAGEGHILDRTALLGYTATREHPLRR